jgi:hypothetical protein
VIVEGDDEVRIYLAYSGSLGQSGYSQGSTSRSRHTGSIIVANADHEIHIYLYDLSLYLGVSAPIQTFETEPNLLQP